MRQIVNSSLSAVLILHLLLLFPGEDEAYPPKYISELCTSYDYGLEQDVDDDDRTVASSNSFCSLNTIENVDYIDVKERTEKLLTSTPTTNHQTKYKTSENLTTDLRFRTATDKNVLNKKQKRFSFDVTMLKSNTKPICDSKSCDRFDANTEEQNELSNELQKLKVSSVEYFDAVEKDCDGLFDNYWDAVDESIS